ncbi:MAG: aminotransferase class III-fold pyridoxal phosphate-dependent enzyme, partial [Firmicutes bacterium]|nr:aminotransferase class III-fold pyridoxal phosphate-dependent enzyme [Bacillota bacterium]
DAICEQAKKMPFIGPGFAVECRSDAAEAIVELSGMKNAKVFFTNAGAEANENAIKIARQYTGKQKIFSQYRCYHGSSAGAGMLTGEPRHFYNEPGGPGFVKYDGPYAYRAPKACKFENDEEMVEFYLELLENQILYEGPENIAAIWYESVVGSNGVLVTPASWYQGVRALCDKYEILMVADEVMAGWYRTGKPFAYMNFGYEPDMFTFAKGATCGYVPLGGVVMQEKIAKFFDDTALGCGLTYSAHPMGCAAAVATIKEYKAQDVEGKMAVTSKVLAEILDGYVDAHSCVGEVRHIGLFSAIELVKDKETREPLVPYGKDPEGIMKKIIGMLLAEGFYTYSHENMILVTPPLIITEEELRTAMEVMDKVLTAVDKMI